MVPKNQDQQGKIKLGMSALPCKASIQEEVGQEDCKSEVSLALL